ncbi:MAG: hypothetical protein JWO63_2196, partial [Frankiales bacterium]|nr:hypothetical protein [Frankiales bacterium]
VVGSRRTAEAAPGARPVPTAVSAAAAAARVMRAKRGSNG